MFEDVTPYALVDFVDYPDGGDPYFVDERSHVTATAGVRWLVAEAMALKAQGITYRFFEVAGTHSLGTWTSAVADDLRWLFRDVMCAQ